MERHYSPDSLNIVFCSSEIVPFAKTGGMADVCGALPLALDELGHQVTLVLPYYKSVDGQGFSISRLNEEVSVTELREGIRVLLIRHDGYFQRDGLYGDPSGDYPDNLARFHFFCRKALEALPQAGVKPDIIHCHDWHTGLIPVLLKYAPPADGFFERTPTVFTIHNMAYQGLFPADEFSQLGLDKKLFQEAGFEFYGKINLLKAGLVNSDVITTVSPTYAREIQTEEQGCGLSHVLREREASVVGILNGIDEEVWDPGRDPYLTHSYSAAQLQGKARCKSDLQKAFHLPVKRDIPVYGFVGRLSYQKGIDLLAEAMGRLAERPLQIIILGVGDQKHHDMLQKLADQYPDKLGLKLDFSEEWAHRIYAGSDLFLMPSIYEPCGLSQMISLKYGTIPVVYRTGGLADTIRSYHDKGNGFVFSKYTVEAFVDTIGESLRVFRDQERFGWLVNKAFQHDFSWQGSARQYIGVYRQLKDALV